MASFTVRAALFAVPLVVLGLSGCAGKRTLAVGGAVSPVERLETPTQASLAAFEAQLPFRLGAFDKVAYTHTGLEGVEGEAVVDTSGFISVAGIGQIRAGGLTPGEVEQQIVAALRRQFVRNPTASVAVSQLNSQTVTVEGAVREPGLYPARPGIRLIDAVALAKGLTEDASSQEVVVFRTIGDQRYAALYNLAAIRNGVYEDPRIFAGDVISISESRGRRLFRDLLTAAPGILSPLVILLTR